VPFEFTLTEDEPTLLAVLSENRGIKSLWLIAAIHYEDRFGGLHAAGYGRRLATGRGSTLLFQFTPEPGPFNYDGALHPDQQRHYGKGRELKAATANRCLQ
jgi:hypothetical protein